MPPQQVSAGAAATAVKGAAAAVRWAAAFPGLARQRRAADAPVADLAGSTGVLQAPQWAGSVRMFAQVPLQQLSAPGQSTQAAPFVPQDAPLVPGRQFPLASQQPLQVVASHGSGSLTQVPFWQTCPESQAVAQPPQCAGSVWTSAQVPLQQLWAPGQSTQVAPAAPQAAPLVPGRQFPVPSQQPSQLPGPQVGVSETQFPFWQVWLDAQAVPQPPQCAGSVVRSAQVPLQQLCWPGQSTQVVPAMPQDAPLVPGRQLPLASQQPSQLVEPHVGGLETQLPFWQTCPNSSQVWQVWSVPQTRQTSPQSASAQQPPG